MIDKKVTSLSDFFILFTQNTLHKAAKVSYNIYINQTTRIKPMTATTAVTTAPEVRAPLFDIPPIDLSVQYGDHEGATESDLFVEDVAQSLASFPSLVIRVQAGATEMKTLYRALASVSLRLDYPNEARNRTLGKPRIPEAIAARQGAQPEWIDKGIATDNSALRVLDVDAGLSQIVVERDGTILDIDANMLGRWADKEIIKSKIDQLNQCPSPDQVHSPLDFLSWLSTPPVKRPGQDIEKTVPEGIYVVTGYSDYYLKGDKQKAEVINKIRNMIKPGRLRRVFVVLVQEDNRGVPAALDGLPPLFKLPKLSHEETVNMVCREIMAKESWARKTGCHLDVEITLDEVKELARVSLGVTEGEISQIVTRYMLGRLNGKNDNRKTVKANLTDLFLEVKTKRLGDMGLDFRLPCETVPQGMELLDEWLEEQEYSFKNAGRTDSPFSIEAAKGTLFVGPPGSGKSIAAQSVSRKWNVPLVKMDIGKMYGSLVGETEANLRAQLDAIASCGPCVAWFDEIEKGMSGASSAGGDAGTSQRVLGHFLTWLEHKPSHVYVIMTANDIRALLKKHAEFFRIGRLDRIFYVGLPTKAARQSIIVEHLKGNPVSSKINYSDIIDATEHFSGAEVAQVAKIAINNAARSNAKSVNAAHLLNAAMSITPQALDSDNTSFTELQAWGEKNAAPVARPDVPAKKGKSNSKGEDRGVII